MSSRQTELLHTKEKPYLRRMSTRKKWSVQEDPEKLLRQMRSQLAEDGCVESQLRMAQIFLEREEEEHNEENQQHAVHWLVQASLQGNMKATKLLQACLQNNSGISEQNYDEVKACLAMDQQEKLAKAAAKQIFFSCSVGSNFITLTMLNNLVHQIVHQVEVDADTTSSEKLGVNDTAGMLEKKYGSIKIAESRLIGASQRYACGLSPDIVLNSPYILSKCVSLSDCFFLAVLHKIANCVQLVMACCRMLYMYCIVLFGISLVVLTWVHIIHGCLYALWALSLVAIIFSLTSVLKLNAEWDRFQVWSLLLKHFSEDLDVIKVQQKFQSRYFPLYITYAIGVCLYVFIVPLINSGILSFVAPVLAVISSLMVWNYLRHRSIVECVAIFLCSAVFLCEKAATIAPFIQHYIPLHENQFHFNETVVFGVLDLNLNAGSFFQLMWLAVLIYMRSKLGIHSVLEHVSCITFVHVTFDTIMTAKMSELLSGFIFVFIVGVVPISLAYLSIIFTGLLCLGCGLLWNEHLVLNLAASVFVVSCLGVMTRWLPKISWLIKITIWLIASIYLLNSLTFDVNAREAVSDLQWEAYQNVCLPTKDSFSARSVYSCRPLAGTKVQWEGVVTNVEVSAVTNRVQDLSSMFPTFLQEQVRCFLGRTKQPCGSSIIDHSVCELVNRYQHSCSLEDWNRYEFRFTVSMGGTFWNSKSPTIILNGDSTFKQMAFHLSLNDRIAFIASLERELGTHSLELDLSSIKCIECKHFIPTVKEFNDLTELNSLYCSASNVFNFLFAPFLTIHSQ